MIHRTQYSHIKPITLSAIRYAEINVGIIKQYAGQDSVL